MLPLDVTAAPRGPLCEPWPDPEPWDSVLVLLDARATWAVRIVEEPGGRWWALDHAALGVLNRRRLARC